MQDCDFKIDNKEVLRYLGYRGQDINDELKEKTERMIKLCLEKASPLYGYRLFETVENENGIALKGTDVILRGASIKKHLKGAKMCAVMAVTLGAQIERQLYALQHSDMPGAVIFNSACTALTEAVADRCCDLIKQEAENKGFGTGARYSPGYGDFPVEQQKDVLLLLDAQRKLGITLTDSFLMVPRKSVTAVVGLYCGNSTNEWCGCKTCNKSGKCAYERR